MFWRKRKKVIIPKEEKDFAEKEIVLPTKIFPEDVVQRINTDYPKPEDRKIVVSSLFAFSDEMRLEGPRLIRCILFESKYGVSDFEANLLSAKSDWRDIIHYAEYEDGVHTYNFNEPFDEARMKPGEKYKGPRKHKSKNKSTNANN